MAVKKRQTAKTSSNVKKKSPSKKTETDSLIVKIKTILADGRTKILLAALTLFLSIFIFLAFVSFLFDWSSDQSQIGFENIANANNNSNNSSGEIGLLIANLFIYKWFGVASFSFIFILFVISLNFVNIKIISISKAFKYSIVATLWLSVTLSFIFGSKYLILGGSHGYYLSNWLSSILGVTGAAFVLFIFLAGFILFTFENSYTWFISKLSFLEHKSENVIFKSQSKTQESKIEAIAEEKIKISKETELDLDTNEFVETVDRKRLLIYDNGKVVENQDVGFEVDNTTSRKEENKIEDPGLVLDVQKNQDIQADEINQEPYDPTKELSNYKFPPIDILEDHKSMDSIVTNEELQQNKIKIVETLRNYKIEIVKIKATIGPTITLYEIIPAPGVRISKIKNLEDDIALSLAALGIRIIAPMPGRGTIGIEVPNLKPEIVSMKSVISSLNFQKSKYELPIALGKTISNESYVFDLAKMPHLLVAGATGQGKSVGLNAIITSLLYKKHPSQVKFIFVDPKKVELTLYEKIEKHFLAKLPDTEDAIITNNADVIHTLNSLSKEMDNRYNLLKAGQVRNIKEYNEKFINRRLNPQKGHKYLPYLILVVDEFADLIMTSGKEIELPIARLAQLARAVGIHLIIATQRPSTNIITGTIKANFPARLAFKVASMIDSRTILDASGANQLIGRGDMLITEGSELIRLQCAFIDTKELDNITSFIQSQQSYPSAFLLPEPDTDDTSKIEGIDFSTKDDLFEDAARIVVLNQQGSTSLIQRKLSIGYNRAGRIIDQLEAVGIVGQFEGSKARQVLIPDEYSLEQLLRTLQ
ncbi:MAG: DNA translocase FtsK [Bacteroidales bacterium]|nr:DNA translocase FtsK [Bacteroidales bacterium]MBN2756167.1 DNA translocase FtsK [Bacteroidales bacterium]